MSARSGTAAKESNMGIGTKVYCFRESMRNQFAEKIDGVYGVITGIVPANKIRPARYEVTFDDPAAVGQKTFDYYRGDLRGGY
tara:strand:+ start:543 stop:791 length:249 start_codon:yes stop_codon:yes gene_type:complete